MKSSKSVLIIGVVLILFGLVGLTTGGFSFTTRETVLDIGPIEATAEERHGFGIPQAAAIAAMVAGVALVFVGMRRA
jgi:hypothetical protein